MARIATKDGTYIDEQGVRRLVVKGDQIPAHGLEGFTDFEEADVRTLARPVVDEASSQPSEAATKGDPSGGVSFDNVERLQKSSGAKSSGSKES